MASLGASQRAPGVRVFGVAASVAAIEADSDVDLGQRGHDACDERSVGVPVSTQLHGLSTGFDALQVRRWRGGFGDGAMKT